jgi:uncharacterized protein YjdB
MERLARAYVLNGSVVAPARSGGDTMKKLALLITIAALTAACDSGITDTGRPILVTGNNTGASTATGVFIDPGNIGLSVSSTAQLSARALDANGAAITGAVAWTSSNAAVASVDANGVVTGRGAGTALITATINGRSGSAVVSVT